MVMTCAEAVAVLRVRPTFQVEDWVLAALRQPTRPLQQQMLAAISLHKHLEAGDTAQVLLTLPISAFAGTVLPSRRHLATA